MKNSKNIDDNTDRESLVEKDNPVKLKPKRTLKKKEPEDYSEDALNISLYYEISSTIYNSLSNLIVRKAIISDENLLKVLELQISNLFFLEKELKGLKDKKYAREFLQVISNLMDRSLSITKSFTKNRIEILEERNLLIVSITNSCKTVERESLERIRQFNDDTFNELHDQILALNNFSDDSSEIKTVTTVNNSDNSVANPMTETALDNNTNINNIDSTSLANLTKLGVLPQHPSINPKFYPYISKPKYIPLLKKVLSGFLILTTILILVAYILTFFVSGDFVIKIGDSVVSYNLGKNSNSTLSIVIAVALNAGFVYSILKPPKLGRDTYRTSYFLLVILIFWLVFSISNIIMMTTDSSLTDTFKSFIKEKDDLNPFALPWLKGLRTFQAFRILAYIAGVSAIFPIAIALVIAILNPKIDRNKIIKANAEYQNAINNALNGKPYEMDPTLFDESLDKDNKKNKHGHKFWHNSDLFK